MCNYRNILYRLPLSLVAQKLCAGGSLIDVIDGRYPASYLLLSPGLAPLVGCWHETLENIMHYGLKVWDLIVFRPLAGWDHGCWVLQSISALSNSFWCLSSALPVCDTASWTGDLSVSCLDPITGHGPLLTPDSQLTRDRGGGIASLLTTAASPPRQMQDDHLRDQGLLLQSGGCPSPARILHNHFNWIEQH